jgi:hypothetical protein
MELPDGNRAVLPAPPPNPDHNGMSDGRLDMAGRQRSHRQPLLFTVKLAAPAPMRHIFSPRAQLKVHLGT